MTSERTVNRKDIQIGKRTYSIVSDDDYLANMEGSFEPEMCALFEALIEPHYRVFDIGANIGCTSLLFGALAAQVDSFEPSPSTFEYLSANIAAAGLSTVRLHNFGLGKVDEELTLTFSPANRSGGFVSNVTQAGPGHTVENIRIRSGDGVLSRSRVDFIKIDVEGFEKNVIEGLKDVIQRNQPIVVLELNHWCLNAFQRTSIPDFFDFLLETFPVVYAIDGKRFADLRDPSDRYKVMYEHIVRFKYPNLVGAFTSRQVEPLVSTYSR
jgi:FkbM family methyltransferase